MSMLNPENPLELRPTENWATLETLGKNCNVSAVYTPCDTGRNVAKKSCLHAKKNYCIIVIQAGEIQKN